jgi:hypothetical protein
LLSSFLLGLFCGCLLLRRLLLSGRLYPSGHRRRTRSRSMDLLRCV